MPREGTVAAVVDELDIIAQHDGRSGDIEPGCRSRLAHHNLLRHAALAVGIGGGKRHLEDARGGIESRGVGASQLLDFSAWHAPQIGASAALGVIDETEAVACGKGVAEHLESSYGSLALGNRNLLPGRKLGAVGKGRRASHIVRSSLSKGEGRAHAVQDWHRGVSHAPSPVRHVQQGVGRHAERDACQMRSRLLDNGEPGRRRTSLERAVVLGHFPSADGTEIGVLAIHILAQTGLAIHLDGFHRNIHQQVGLKGRRSDTHAHVVPYLQLRAGRTPYAYLVQSAYPPLVDVRCAAELEVSESSQPRV